jgi:hypothetical protein
MSAGAPQCVRPRAVAWWPDAISPNLSLEARACGGQGLCWYVLVDVHRLGMLAQVVEARESPRAVALEGPFAGVLAGSC